MKPRPRTLLFCVQQSVSDVINKAGRCDKCIKHVTGQLCLLFVGKKPVNMAASPGAKIQSKKVLVYILLENPNDASRRSYLHLFSVPSPTCVLIRFCSALFPNADGRSAEVCPGDVLEMLWAPSCLFRSPVRVL